MDTKILILLIILIAKTTTLDYCKFCFDIFQNQPKFIPLPSGYVTQDMTKIKLHPFKIRQAWDLSDIKGKHFDYKLYGQIFQKAAYYFEKVIEVQTINPRSQTFLQKLPIELYIPQTRLVTDIAVSSHFLFQGFDPNKIDLIVFSKFYDFEGNNIFQSNVLQFQRRPVYGYMLFDFGPRNQGSAYKQFAYHNRIRFIIHSLMHILAYNPHYILKQIFVDVHDLVIDQNYQTKFFKNAYTNQRKKQSQVLRKNPLRAEFLLITQKARKAAYQIYGCSRSITQQQMGIPLQNQNQTILNQTRDFIQVETLDFHFSAQYVNANILMIKDPNSLRANIQQGIISLLDLKVLEDTGFYEKINYENLFDYEINITDRQEYQIQNYYNKKYHICTLQQTNLTNEELYCPINNNISHYTFQCDIYGTSTNVGIVQVYNQIVKTPDGQFNKCQNNYRFCPYYDFNQNRCILSAHIDTIVRNKENQFCVSANCFIQNDVLKLKVEINGKTYYGCYPDDPDYPYLIINRERDQKLVCPKYMDVFCQVKLCPNACSFKGFCINGECLIPPSQYKLQQDLKLSSIALNLSYSYYQQEGRLCTCPPGCALCKCQIVNQQCLMPGLSFSQGKAILEHETGSIQIVTCIPCSFFCGICEHQANITFLSFVTRNYHFIYKIKCTQCFSQFFHIYLEKNASACGKCISQSCTDCLAGINSGKQCTNCVQGHYLDQNKICQPCTNLGNCLLCQKINGEFKCLKCVSGYHLTNYTDFVGFSKIKNTCIKCLPDCGKCDQNDIRICYQCFLGYFLTKNQKGQSQCKQCSQNCIICESQSLCTKCKNKFYVLNKTTSHCSLQCNPSCLTCNETSPNQCIRCPLDYDFIQENKTCKPKLSCNTLLDFCLSCPTGYGQVIQSAKKAKCEPCRSQHCTACGATVNVCYQCQNGFYIEYDDGQCKPCPQSCKTCESIFVCTSCYDGYANQKNIDGSAFENKCIQCTDNCKTCSGSPHQCLSCKDNYKQVGHTCLPEAYSINLILDFIDIPSNSQQSKQFISKKLYTQAIYQVKKLLDLGGKLQFTLLNIINEEQVYLSLEFYLGSDKNLIQQLKAQYNKFDANFKVSKTKNTNKINEQQKFKDRILQECSTAQQVSKSFCIIEKQCLFEIYMNAKLSQVQLLYLGVQNIAQKVRLSNYNQATSKCSLYKLIESQSSNTLLIALLSSLIPTISIIIILVISLCYAYQKYRQKQKQARQLTRKIQQLQDKIK